MSKASIVIIADKTSHPLYRTLSINGESIEFLSCRGTFNLIKDCRADIVLIDCGFNSDIGLKLLGDIKTLHPNAMVLFITDVSSEETAIDAFRAGARDYLQKPINVLELQKMVKNLLKIKRESRERRSPYVRSEKRDRADEVTGITTDKPLNLLQVIRYIHENYAEAIDLEDCAKEANLSKYQFCRNFKKYFGITPMRFVTFVRINRAKDLLRRDDLNITEVALQVGFNDHGSFIRGFKKLNGLTPKEYRNSTKTKRLRGQVSS